MSFKTVAYTVLENAKKPLHYETIISIAKKTGKLSWKTPEAKMNAVLIADINKHKNKSVFTKKAPGIYALNTTIRKGDFLRYKTEEHLLDILKTKHSIIIGEGTLGCLRQKVYNASQIKIKICGRSSETGRKKAVKCVLADLL